MITDKSGKAHFVIDQHVHVGMRPARSTTASSSYLPDELITNMDANGVDMVVGFPKANSHTDYRVENERIIAAMKQHPTRIVAFAGSIPILAPKRLPMFTTTRRKARSASKSIRCATSPATASTILN